MRRYQPALLGGLVIGVLSSLPVVSAANLCCCLWVVAGGLLAAYLRQQSQPEPIEAVDGALTGLMAGIVGAVISILVATALRTVTGPAMEERMREILDQNQQMPPGTRDLVLNMFAGRNIALLMAAVVLPVYAVFAMLGGLLGVAFFKKKTPPAIPSGGTPTS